MTVYSQTFKAFSLREMTVRPDTIKSWSNQDADKELKELAQSVIDAAGGGR